MRASRPEPSRALGKLRSRLAEAEGTLRAVRAGEVDTVVVSGKNGPQVFTLEGAGLAYRLLIESMNEGALTLTDKGVILYANQCFARMVKFPLGQVMGSSFRRFLTVEDRSSLRLFLKHAGQSGLKHQVRLSAGDGSQLPALISIRPLAGDGSKRVAIGMVVTDMTEARLTEDRLRALTRRVVQVQEAERGRVALELHDNITQLLCAILLRCQTLADRLSPRDRPLKREAVRLSELLGQTAVEVERISRNLRPGVLEHLGLVTVLRDTTTEFAKRTGVALALTCVQLPARLPAEIELTLYRILQEALQNVEKHARARHVTVCLRLQGASVQLTIRDDGIGFNPETYLAKRKEKGGLGLLGLRERATYVGGALTIKSARSIGTEIQLRIPVPPGRLLTQGADL